MDYQTYLALRARELGTNSLTSNDVEKANSILPYEAARKVAQNALTATDVNKLNPQKSLYDLILNAMGQ